MESNSFIRRLLKKNKRNFAYFLLALFVAAGVSVCFSLCIFVGLILSGGLQMIRDFIEGTGDVAAGDNIVFWSIPGGVVGLVIGVYMWKALLSKTDWISAEEIARLTRW